MKLRSTLFCLTILTGVVFLTGCPPKKKLEIETKKTDQQVVEDTSTIKTSDLEAIQISQDWAEIPALSVVPFAYDSANIDDAARSVLKTNIAVLKKLPKSVTVRVEGHCDDRGTVEYNIALGQRRANAVRQYYVTAGVAKTRIETISFGEERPLCTQETDACWAQNRRATTKVRNSEAIKLSPDSLK